MGRRPRGAAAATRVLLRALRPPAGASEAAPPTATAAFEFELSSRLRRGLIEKREACHALLTSELAGSVCERVWGNCIRAAGAERSLYGEEQALRLLRRMEELRVVPSSKTLCFAMSAVAATDPHKAIELFRDNAQLLQTSRHAWLNLVNALGRSKHPDLSDRLSQVAAKLRAAQSPTNVLLDAQMHGALVQAAARGSCVAAAQHHLSEMLSSGFTPRDADVRLLVTAFSQTSNAHLAAGLANVSLPAGSASALSTDPRVSCGPPTREAVLAYLAMSRAADSTGTVYVQLALHCASHNSVDGVLVLLEHLEGLTVEASRRVARHVVLSCMHILRVLRTAQEVYAPDVLLTYAVRALNVMPYRDAAAWTRFLEVHQTLRGGGSLAFIDRMEAEGVPRSPTMFRIAMSSAEEMLEFADSSLMREIASKEGIFMRATI
eukprot:Rhum_TRINITY_DN13666_c0_g1::Rhum_TRINITY_DN13666_c0_g1_i1::g.62571::m.62571